MKRLLRERVGALMLASALGVTGMFGYERFVKPNEIYAAGEQDAGDEENTFKRITFAEGEGTGKEFSPESWYFLGIYQPDKDNPETKTIRAQNVKPGIYANEYSTAQEKEKVIRLISGVRSDANGIEVEEDQKAWDDATSVLEAGKSAWNFRSGKATLSIGEEEKGTPIELDEDQNFALKFTFSMPEAVVNIPQCTEEKYAREYGGDGIAFIMTTTPDRPDATGDGIGYGGMTECFAIELDSFYNGAEWNGTKFDNGVVGEYNYENVGHAERFDHVAITVDGEPKVHKAISYLNGIEPSWDNFAFSSTNAMNGATAQSSTLSTCATRFTDKNVNDRLFTVWVEYDGANNMMHVSYANGDFKTAEKPATPQISQEILLDEHLQKENPDDESYKVYMGFTSAVGSSKANHTIHAFQFTNAYEPITGDASYSVEYYFQDPQDPSKYTKDEKKTLKVTETENAGVTTKVQATDVVNDTEYAKQKFAGYEYAKVENKSVDKITVAADGSSVLKLYYDVADTAKCKVEYYKLDPDTEEYEVDTTIEKTGNVGDIITLEDVDGDYADKYAADHYVVNDEMTDKDPVTLEEKDQTYVIKVYYVPETTTYKTVYYREKEDGTWEETETEQEAYVGKTVQAEIPDYDGYTHITTDGSNETATVEADGSTVLKVYYEKIAADTVNYQVQYYKLDPNTEEDVLAKTEEKTGNVGDTITIANADSSYADKYVADHYEVDTTRNQDWTVTLDDKDTTYVIKVYYNPEKITYKTVYYREQEDGTWEETETQQEAYVGKTVQAEIPDYAGYTHVTTDGSNETDTVKADGSTVLKVYYEKLAADTAKYKVEYYKLDPNTEEYTKAATGTEQTGNVGATITLVGADSNYADKYAGEHYVVNASKTAESVVLAAKDQTYVLKVYYDPEKVTYKTVHYREKEDGTWEETITEQEAYVGKTVHAETPTYDGYIHITTVESQETATVKADGSTVLKVYYEKIVAAKASYKLEYYKLNPETKEYELIESSPAKEGEVGTRYTIEDINSSYATKYAADNYIVNTEKTQKSVVLEAKDQTYTMKVYYAPKTTYKIEYWLQKPDGTYEKKEEVTDNEAYAGQLIEALIKAYVGYSHTTTDDSLETAVVTIDGTTVLKVYYKAEAPTEGPSVDDPTEAPSVEDPTEAPSVEDPTEAPSTEEPTEAPSEKPSEEETGDKTTEPPMTGDAMSYAWFVLLLAAAVGGSLVIVKTKKD